MARHQDSWATCTLLIVAIVSLLLALTPVVAHADLIDPDTGKYNGPVLVLVDEPCGGQACRC